MMNKKIDYELLYTGVKDTFSIKRNIKELTEFNYKEYLLMFLMVGASIVAFMFQDDFSFSGYAGVVTSVATAMSLILVDKGKLTNFMWGTIGSLSWLIASLNNRLIGDIASQVFYTIMQFVGIYVWYKTLNASSSDSVTSKRITPYLATLTGIGLIALYIINVCIGLYYNGNLVLWDSAVLPLGIIGQILMTYGYRSQWVIWIGLDVLNIYIWYTRLTSGGASALSMLVLQVIMTINAIYGAYVWYTKENNSEVANNE